MSLFLALVLQVATALGVRAEAAERMQGGRGGAKPEELDAHARLAAGLCMARLVWGAGGQRQGQE